MGIREFYAQYMNRPGFEYLPDPLGRLGQGKWVKTAQGPEAPTPPKAPVTPKPVPPTPPKGARKKPGLVDPPKKARGRYRLRNGRVLKAKRRRGATSFQRETAPRTERPLGLGPPSTRPRIVTFNFGQMPAKRFFINWRNLANDRQRNRQGPVFILNNQVRTTDLIGLVCLT